ncbi:bifunctional diguanylate cyclase/phosphodiesterase [Massilia yuzhufengensis]|uniref:PAS domain S-box-containing protein/diguanylate cyclase (GGDEF) domain-containing protein n=1 Tax=Massilia yuzhufengensis TaxID=1164594 RepID=A0A1I1R1K2_9BURK|nr:EAL domain-containing protein [Massilia yuzhufengensis]SFD25998.1 PAS domain S-box-containing protein/diguanylate cyclase (GGDEF) domain-containing protein [Massilia yuzhufengensis]
MNRLLAHPLLRRRRAVSRAAVVTLLAGFVLTAVLFGAARQMEGGSARADFEQRTAVRTAAVTRAFAGAVYDLRALNLLFAASGGDVSRDAFDAFAQPLASRNGYLVALEFQRFVSAAERPAFEAARRRFWPGFSIRERSPAGVLVPAAARERYLVNDYVVPIASNSAVFGYDAWARDEQRAFMQRAIDSGEPVASPVLRLVQGDGGLRGVLVSMPVYRPGADLSSVAGRRAAAVGTTTVVLDAGLLVGGSLNAARLLTYGDYTLELYGRSSSGRKVAVFSHPGAPDPQAAWERWLGGPAVAITRSFTVAGSHWDMQAVRVARRLDGQVGSLSMLGYGLVLSIAAAALVQQRSARTRRIESLVERRTADLAMTAGALRLHQRAIEAAANPILLISATRPGYPIEYANPSCERTLGYGPGELVGKPVSCLSRAGGDEPGLEELRQALQERRKGHALVHQAALDGRELVSEVYLAPVNDADGHTEHFVVTTYDVTMAKRYEAELAHRARYDTLTGLANRALLSDRIERAIATAGGNPVWAVALDIDHFKLVNDTLGRKLGDEALRGLAARIAGALRQADTAARTGGDDFMLVLCGCADERQAAARLQAVREAIGEPLECDGHTLVFGSSAGVAGYPADGRDPETLVKHAEVAMYRAKQTGRNAVQFYAPHMNAHAIDRLALEGALRGALRDDQFELYFQPQVDLGSGRVVGTEALIRWRHPDFGTVRPDRFIGLAEETGLIVPIGDWVLRAACRQNRAWQHAGLGPLRIAVNLSARQFSEPGLVQNVRRVLDETGLAAPSLEIELTESMMMADVEAAIETMRCLKAMGVKLSIDDFGTGYSSLAYLKRFPVDVLKIDRSFIRDIVGSPDGAAMVDAIISLAHGLRMQVIAEGVETLEQLDYLRGCGCDEVQGHIYARPEPVREVELLLRKGTMEPTPLHA